VRPRVASLMPVVPRRASKPRPSTAGDRGAPGTATPHTERRQLPALLHPSPGAYPSACQVRRAGDALSPTIPPSFLSSSSGWFVDTLVAGSWPGSWDTLYREVGPPTTPPRARLRTRQATQSKKSKLFLSPPHLSGGAADIQALRQAIAPNLPAQKATPEATELVTCNLGAGASVRRGAESSR